VAALSEIPVPQLAELRHLRAADLAPILEQETKEWRSELDWNFSTSADLVHRFTDMQALNGHALLVGGRAVGYTYFVCEERKGLIGDLYVLPEYCTVINENLLLRAALDSLMHTPYVRRIEAQLMMMRSPLERLWPHSRFVRVYPRSFLDIDLSSIESLPVRPSRGDVMFETWMERNQEEAAQVIATAYQGHIDSQINDQYRSLAGARRFLLNIVQYPGCGSFFQPASVLAVRQQTGRLGGVCLSSLVAPQTGHITQVCVTPQMKKSAVGYELIRRSLNALAEHHCLRASLTVTDANQEALQLYDRLGFVRRRGFAACVWEGF
jgi:ribosomal protein S18 acetylase RimI-like enzyme